MASQTKTYSQNVSAGDGGPAFSYPHDSSVEIEYDRLRNLAHQEGAKRSECFDKAHAAHEAGNGHAAKELSEEGKHHGENMKQYNQQASEYIFRENNASDRVPADTIDLHGQYVEEAGEILEKRIRYAQAHGQDHLHVIVGKGNHSQDHVQKLKPRVEQVCRELGLHFATEENDGRIYVNLTGAAVETIPPLPAAGDGYHSKAEEKDIVGNVLDKLVGKLNSCCIVM